MSDEADIRKLPVWRTVKASYLVVFHNRNLAIKLAIVPAVLMALSPLLESYLWGGMTLEQWEQEDPTTSYYIIGTVLPLVSYLSTIPMLTAWHRLVIHGHDHSAPRIRYTVTQTETSYLGLAAILYISYVVISAVLLSVSFFGLESSIDAVSTEISALCITKLYATIIMICTPIYAILLRFGLVLPATAIGQSIGFGESWNRTKNNTWQMLLSSALVIIPFTLLGDVIYRKWANVIYNSSESQILPTLGYQILLSIIDIPLLIVCLCVSASLWSWFYRYLVQKEPITLPGE